MSKPGKSLKGLCKKLGVRLTVKRGQKRVYKSVKVLKEQCANKKKKVKRRKARFGVALSSQQQADADRVAGYNRQNIEFVSENLMNGSHDNIVKMLTMIVNFLQYDRHFASRSAEYLIHNGFFKSSTDSRIGSYSRPIDHFSKYLLFNYNNKVKLEPSSIGDGLISTVNMSERVYNLNDPTYIDRRNASKRRTKEWLLKTDSRGNVPNPNIPLDEMIHKLNDDDLRAYKFFMRDHMKLYLNYAAEYASDKYNDSDREYMNNHIQFLDRGYSSMFGWIDNYPIVIAGGHRVAVEHFLIRIFDELVLLKHKARIMVSNNNYSSDNICKNVKEPTNSEMNNDLPGKITYNIVNPYINLCSCQDFYYIKFPIRENNVGLHPQINIKNRYRPRPDEPRRMCKHLRREQRGDDNFTWGGPNRNFIYTADFLRQIMNNNEPTYEPELSEEEIRQEAIRKITTVQRNIVRTGPEQHCNWCFNKPFFLIKNCNGGTRRNRTTVCTDSLICIGCIKNYPSNWRENMNPRTKCGLCRGRLDDQKKNDIEILRRDISLEEFNEISGTNNAIADQRLDRRGYRGLADAVRRGGGRVFFGKKKKKVGIPVSLKKVCKRLKIRLTIKRKGKRVYKSVKVLKALCKKALKKKKKVLRKRKVKKRKIKKKRKVKKRKVKKRKVKKKRVKRKFGRNITPYITKAPVGYNASKLYRHQIPSQKSLKMISGEPKANQKYKSYKGSSSTYGF